jgi:hypothetical protein
MATKKWVWVLFAILIISGWVLGTIMQAGAETLNYKLYAVTIKADSVPIGDREGHNIGLLVRSGFMVFENGEVATGYAVILGDMAKGTASNSQYVSVTFSDGSTIIRKDQITISGGTAPGTNTGTSEIIKGTHATKGAKFIPGEKWEAGPKLIHEGTYTYMLPSK